jgi:hypothetical protein
MKRTKKQIVRAVRVLTDPQPNFVSHVRNGANQTPALILKADDTEQPVQTGQAKEAHMPKTKAAKAPTTVSAPIAAPAQAERKVEVHSIFFALDKFDAEESVKAYLSEHGYTADALVEKDGVGWTVKGSDFDQFEDGLQEIEAAEGVTLTVGYLKADADAAPAAKSEGEQPEQEVETAKEDAGAEAATADTTAADTVVASAAADSAPNADAASTETIVQPAAAVTPAAEPVAASAAVSTPVQPADLVAALAAFDAALPVAQKALTMLASREATSKADPEAVRKFESLNDVLSYMDDVPPGFYEVMQAFSVVVRYAMQDGDMSRVAPAAKSMGEYIVALAAMFRPTEAKAADVATKDASANAGVTTTDEAAVDPVLKAIKDLGARMDGINSRVEQIAGAQAPAEGSEPAPVQRGRKGEDEGAEPVTPSPKETKVRRYLDEVPEDRLFRNTMGLPHKRQH